MKTDERTKLEILDQPDSLRKTIDQEYGKIDSIAKWFVKNNLRMIYIVGMGSSYSAALVAKTFSDSVTSLPVYVYRGYEFEFQEPVGLGRDCCVILLSFSGETEDVVSALRFARAHGAYTVSISGPEENTLAREAHYAISIVSRDTKAMLAAHSTQVVVLYLLLGLIAKYRGESTRVDNLKRELEILIQRLPGIIAEEEEKARRLAEQFKRDSIFYVISAGPNYGLAYKIAMTQMTENAWLHGVVQYSTEFRHGIVEIIEEGLPVIFLIGSDRSQSDVSRELETCQKLKARTIVWDAKDFPKTDEFLTPLYLAVPTQWFVYYLAIARGRLPSDRRHMGSVIPYASMKVLARKGGD
jgi:glucosamine--fructose-6-phosphate aminotransferase (isomerizing)